LTNVAHFGKPLLAAEAFEVAHAPPAIAGTMLSSSPSLT
jgi:hypothetical protein